MTFYHTLKRSLHWFWCCAIPAAEVFWSGFDKFNCWRVRISKTRNYSEQKDYYYFSHPKPEKFIILIYIKNHYNFQFSLSVILGSDITSIFTFTQFFNAVNFNFQVFWLSSVLFNLHLAQTWHKLTKSKSVLFRRPGSSPREPIVLGCSICVHRSPFASLSLPFPP